MWPKQATMDEEVAAVEAQGEVLPLLSGKMGSKAAIDSEDSSSPVGSLESLSENFGHKLLIILFASQHVMKGFSQGFTQPAYKFLYKDYGVAGPQMQIFDGVVQLPWAMKPIFGLVSDLFPVFGFHKLPYIFFATVVGLMACATVGFVPQAQLPLTHLVICFVLITVMWSTADLLTEAKYAEKMRGKPRYGPALMSYVWGGLTLGSLVAVGCAGPVLTILGNKAPFVIVLLPVSFILFPLSANYLEEKVQTAEDVKETRENMRQQFEAPLLAVLMFLGTSLLTILGVSFANVTLNAVASVGVALVMLISFSVVLRPMIAKVNALSVIQGCLSLSISGASFYFYTDTPAQYPEGPHFSKEFFTSIMGVFSSVCSLFGIWSYQRFASEWTYQRIMITTNLVVSALSMLDVIFFARLNKVMGIPDHVFVLGSSAFESAIGQWMWMPTVVILSQLCPDGMEATMYALLAGCMNLGNTVSSNCGAFLLQWLGCQPDGSPNESAQFENLWKASLVSTILPLFTVVLIPWMIPDAKQTEKLLPDGDRDATKGSLLRMWQGRS